MTAVRTGLWPSFIMLTTYETAQLAATADAIIWEMEKEREVDIERMYVLLDRFRSQLPVPPAFTHRGFTFTLVTNSEGEEGIEVTSAAPAAHQG